MRVHLFQAHLHRVYAGSFMRAGSISFPLVAKPTIPKCSGRFGKTNRHADFEAMTSVITAKAANDYHLKTGQREVTGTFMFYRVIPRPSTSAYEPYPAACYASLLGKKDEAFQLLEKSLKERRGIVLLKVDPQLDNVRSDPRYFDLLKQVGLAE
jgi:hypothetical protein